MMEFATIGMNVFSLVRKIVRKQGSWYNHTAVFAGRAAGADRQREAAVGIFRGER